ncbi:acyl-CoA carboxylase subunit epsilon [Streptomyces sp. NPDC059524]|uniref:acyl-CoA carboxylase subunit epsilon n=1 Tax=Streptomyces sp. NPDC059524 TaxID=3346856 RepID=UPI003688D8FF
MTDGETLLRIERGRANEDELAALTAVLLSFGRVHRPAETHAVRAGSRWWRQPAGYFAPGSWR